MKAAARMTPQRTRAAEKQDEWEEQRVREREVRRADVRQHHGVVGLKLCRR